MNIIRKKSQKNLDVQKEDVEQYVYITMTSVANYMIFAENKCIYPQIRLVIEAMKRLKGDAIK